jgi:hypothetical protein
MSFFNKGDEESQEEAQEEVQGQEEEVVEEVEKIKLGEEEYSQDELQTLVKLGKIGKEAEEKFNTSLDKVWPDYSRKSNQLKEYESELTELRKLKEEKEALPQDEQQAIEEARKAAKKLGIVLEDDLKNQVVTKEDFRQFYIQERAAERLLEEADKLEKEINGKDGRPKFNKMEILEYMKDTGHKNLMDAYEAKYKSETDEWRANQILKAKGRGIMTQEGMGEDKKPSDVKITSQNLDEMMKEALG